jgi:integrase/recombinase XerC
MARKYVKYVTEEKLAKVCDSNKRHIQKYFNFKNMNLSEATKKSYENDFNQWLVFINEKAQEGFISEEDIMKLVKDEDGIEEMVELLEEYTMFCAMNLGNNERRIQRRLSSISSFFLYLLKKKKVATNPLQFLERPRVGHDEKQQVVHTFLTTEQITKIRKELKKLGDLQLELYFEFSLSTCARINAVTNVRLDNIDFADGIVKDVIEKGSKKVELFPSKRAFELIKQWLDFRKKEGIQNDYLFLSHYKKEWNQVTKVTIQTLWIKKISKMIGVPLKCHDLRKSGATLLFNSGLSLEDTQAVLNHSSPETSQKFYIKKDNKKMLDKKRSLEF